jgi:hypothetical protein
MFRATRTFFKGCNSPFLRRQMVRTCRGCIDLGGHDRSNKEMSLKPYPSIYPVGPYTRGWYETGTWWHMLRWLARGSDRIRCPNCIQPTGRVHSGTFRFMPFPGHSERAPSEPSLQFHWGQCLPFGHARFACLARFKFTSWGVATGAANVKSSRLRLCRSSGSKSLTVIIDPAITIAGGTRSDRALLCDGKTICPLSRLPSAIRHAQVCC